MEQKLDKIKYIKRVIIVCWIALAICFLIKLFGGNFFQIICENQTFIAICEFCDNNWWASYIIGIANTLLSTYLFVLAVVQDIKLKLWKHIVLISTCVIGVAIKLWNTDIGWIFDIWQMFIMPAVFIGKEWKQYWKIIVGVCLLLLFQVISLFIRNLAITVVVNSGVLVTAIYSIDITIMLVLYFLYSYLIKLKKGEIK